MNMKRQLKWLAAALALLSLAIWFAFHQRHSTTDTRFTNTAQNQPTSPEASLKVSKNVTNTPRDSVVQSASAAATTGDGKDLDSIRKWAHNELEVERMLNENDKIHRRQLVVLKETVAAVVERNRLTGETIRQLTLTGLDGQEIAFEEKSADIEPSGLRGMFHGIVAGRPDSIVTLAFKNRTQAFTILSPADNLYLDVEPHDPGDVIVKSIDLQKYGAGLCGTK